MHGVQFTLDAWHFTEKAVFWRNFPCMIFSAMCYEPLCLAFISLSTFITAKVVSFVRATVHAKVRRRRVVPYASYPTTRSNTSNSAPPPS